MTRSSERSRRRGGPRTSLLATALASALLVATGAAGARAADDEARGGSFVLRAGRVVTAAAAGPWSIENGVVVVREGRIVAVGADLPLPPDLPVVDEPDAVVIPGLVAAASELESPHGGDESIAAGYRAVDEFDRYGEFTTWVASGVTTAHIGSGAHRLVSGQGAVVKLAGHPDARVLNAAADVSVQLGDPADGPPDLVEYSFPASSDVAIEPARPQRPSSRMSRVQAIDAAVAEALQPTSKKFDQHRAAFAELWRAGRLLRVHADRAVDIASAADFLETHARAGYLVGGAEAGRVVERLRARELAVVYRSRTTFRGAGDDLGRSPETIEAPLARLAALDGVRLALGAPIGGSLTDLRLTAAAAHGAGLPERRALEAVTRAPAEILGVGARVGSIAPGLDADLVVLSGAPLDPRTQVRRVFVDGRTVWRAQEDSALVVRAGTIWVSPDRIVRDGEVLVENGKIAAVGHAVPRPRGARVVDAGPDAFVTPGFIDARNHLELAGERGSASSDLDWTKLVGVPDVTHRRVARAGITTAILSPYSISSTGTRLTALKTAGTTRSERIVRATAGIAFAVSDSVDPLAAKDVLRSTLERGKKYLEAWQKYEKDLAEFLEKQKKGEAITKPAEERTEREPEQKEDPITGIWAGEASGGPIGGTFQGKVALRLEGTSVEGRVVEPEVDEEHRILLTLQGNRLTGHIEVDTGGLGYPRVEAELTGPDAARGTMSLAEISISFTAQRVEKSEVEFKVVRRSTRDKSGRPKPPRIEPALEPFKDLLLGKIPAVVDVSTPKRIEGILETFLDGYKIPLVLLDAIGANVHAAKLAEAKVGVILAQGIVRRRLDEEFHQGDVLSRAGVPIAFQSHAGDGARDLPLAALWAVERGLSADAALAAFTAHAAAMFKIDDRVGSLEPGRDGDLVIFRGHPFVTGAAAERVFVNGREVK